jgi:uncharacterized protein (DUF1501 family)
MPTRRQVMGVLAALPVLGMAAPARAAARAADGERPRFMVLVLRGGLDGLSAVPAHGDPVFSRRRGSLDLGAPGGPGGVLDLGGGFGLHPALRGLHDLYRDGQLIVAHAVASPYRERSHFSAQDVLENGTRTDRGADDGWLARALPPAANGRGPAVALGDAVPLLLRGRGVASWAPSAAPTVDEGILARVAQLYERDPPFAEALGAATGVNRLAETALGPGGRARVGPGERFEATMRAAGRFLAAPEGPRFAAADLGGWDTHFNQSDRLARQLALLDRGIAALRESLGDGWRRTAVLAITEFGRTVAVNGTGGTDHGTAGVALLAGGAVNGGRVLADWPGLGEADLLDGRDLRPTADLRALAKGVLRDHMGVAAAALERDVFPDSAGAAPLPDLIRG